MFSYNRSQNANGVILNCQSKRLLVNIDGIQSTFWIFDTDYKNYVFTYQCKDREKSVETAVFQKSNSFLKKISNEVNISPVSQSKCKTITGIQLLFKLSNLQNFVKTKFFDVFFYVLSFLIFISFICLPLLTGQKNCKKFENK